MFCREAVTFLYPTCTGSRGYKHTRIIPPVRPFLLKDRYTNPTGHLLLFQCFFTKKIYTMHGEFCIFKSAAAAPLKKKLFSFRHHGVQSFWTKVGFKISNAPPNRVIPICHGKGSNINNSRIWQIHSTLYSQVKKYSIYNKQTEKQKRFGWCMVGIEEGLD